jgi:acetyltransferase-like isoleucine patch superfamily enzyme
MSHPQPSRAPATVIHAGTPESADVVAGIRRAWRVIDRLNALPSDDADGVRACFAELTGRDVDAGFRLVPPFRTDHGRNLRVGRNVFINHSFTAMDIGGIEIGDNVMIGPNVQLISSGHPVDPDTRRSMITGDPITIGRNVWIGAGATVLQGVTVGDDAVIGAGAVVTRDVPTRTLVAGVPARVVRQLYHHARPWASALGEESVGGCFSAAIGCHTAGPGRRGAAISRLPALRAVPEPWSRRCRGGRRAPNSSPPRGRSADERRAGGDDRPA